MPHSENVLGKVATSSEILISAETVSLEILNFNFDLFITEYVESMKLI